MELNFSYYPETGPTRDGVVPERDLRIDAKLLHINNKEVDGFYHIGTKKLLPEDISKEVLGKLRIALLNAYHEKARSSKQTPCSVRVWPDQPLPSLSELKSITGK